jgi:hypothetical protein
MFPHPIQERMEFGGPMQYEIVGRKFLGGLINKFLPKLPKAFRKFVEAHKDEPITSIALFRSPLDKISSTFLNALTLGNWDEIKHKGGVDKLFHVYAIINGKYIYEKLALPTFKTASQADLNRQAESLVIPARKINIEAFVNNAIKVMGDKYYTYDGFENNCQDFLLASLKGSMMSSAAATSFLKQDIKKLVEETPSLSKYLGKEATDLAGAGEKLYSEVVDKRGGIRRKKFLVT